jgi:hypothetical protein
MLRAGWQAMDLIGIEATKRNAQGYFLKYCADKKKRWVAVGLAH